MHIPSERVGHQGEKEARQERHNRLSYDAHEYSDVLKTCRSQPRAFVPCVKYGEAGHQGDLGAGHSRRRGRQMIITGLGGTFLVAVCVCVLAWSGKGRGGGMFGQGPMVMAQRLLGASGAAGTGGIASQRLVRELQKEQPLPGKHSQLLHKQPAMAKKEQLVWGDGCGNGATLSKSGDALACSGPGHEDKGMMTHENHCMMFSTHDWMFSAVDAEFEGASDGSNGGWGTIIDPGTLYCLEVLRHPWDGMVGLQVCNRTDDGQLWHKKVTVNGVFGYMAEGNHHVTTYTNMMTGMMLDTGCNGKCYDAQICLPTNEHRAKVVNHDFLDPSEHEIENDLPDDPTAPI